MNFRLKTVLDLLKATFTEWQEDKASRLAAALAYYTVFSLAPLIIIILGVVGLIFSQEEAGRYLMEQIQGLVGASGAELVQSILDSDTQASASLIATLIGVASLVFGATGVFAQLQDALNTVWGVAPNPNKGLMKVVETRFTSLTMVLGIGFLLLVSLVLSAALSALDDLVTGWLPSYLVLGQVLNFIISFGLITLLFAMIYKILPDVEIQWSDVWIGAAVTALLFGVGKFLLGFYLGNQSFGSTYGAAGSILIILLWVYYSAQIFLFGAEFTQVYAKRYGSKIVPNEDAIPITPEMQARQGIPRRVVVEAIAQADHTVRQGEVDYQPDPPAKPDRFTIILTSLFMGIIFVRGLLSSPGPQQNK
ncbi:MAG: YihY/virulence factor BrkB family protein [Anaerolineae bacterium]|nr:YihY/virulence factor BrkB family protein [Anaerolineae bacterium]